MKTTAKFLAVVALTISVAACTVGQQRPTRFEQEREMTVGTVQREIRKGMSGAEVSEALGSPNIVTKDQSGNETWVYDKIATEASYSANQSGLFLILGGFSNQSAQASTTQKTLTVVIRFDGNSKVDSFTYHSSKF